MICRYLPPWLRRLFHCKPRVVVYVRFRCARTMHMTINNDPSTLSILEFYTMSDSVTLTVNATAAQSAVVTATVVVNGVPNTTAGVAWTSSDDGVATVADSANPQSGIVTGVRDGAGPSTRTATITGSVAIGETSYTGSGIATVVTTADSVTVTLDFGTPTP